MDLFQCTIDAVEKYFVNLDKTDCHIVIAYLPPATKLGQGYIFTGLCDSVHRGGVSASVHAGRYGQQVGGMHPTGMHSYLTVL